MFLRRTVCLQLASLACSSTREGGRQIANMGNMWICISTLVVKVLGLKLDKQPWLADKIKETKLVVDTSR